MAEVEGPRNGPTLCHKTRRFVPGIVRLSRLFPFTSVRSILQWSIYWYTQGWISAAMHDNAIGDIGHLVPRISTTHMRPRRLDGILIAQIVCMDILLLISLDTNKSTC